MELVLGVDAVTIRWSLLLGMALVWSCAAPSSTVKNEAPVARAQGPCWLKAPCGPYGPGIYLTGVGGGKTQTEADDAARADLAKILKVKVHESLEMVEKGYSTSGIYGVQSVYSETINRSVRSETDMEIEGIEIARRYEDSHGHHSLAVLERAAAVERADGELEALDREMDRLVNRAEEGDAVVALRDLATATALSREYAVINGQRSVIHGDGMGRPPRHGPNDLSHRLEEKLKGVGISLVVNNEKSGSLEIVLGEVLTAHGFQLVPENSARLGFVGELILNVGAADSYGFKKITGELSLVLKDIPRFGARVYRVLEFSTSASSRKQDKARKIVLADLEKALRSTDDSGAVLGDEVISALLGEASTGGSK